ncbi:alkene reductase [Rhodoblastus acidophilus]|uniref:Alkene reductase n=1 Tax=Candidatus Rhodoblastus alkanivorans TaxID=2954117 RepID=A0ABS9ZB11_9HYPH|nr:alkene reductase [Candidatus Rhodoblastus alkanivorans]MCI4679357.1 alkene reductase [Candidatus Rhodoblastus alkanivorans]MCI4684833.1 alkene reductase [Candidatus Rhodoblastus alkanivorans]MDI4642157.1 alkene reductase [Rhodoblastus acidophilus]
MHAQAEPKLFQPSELSDLRLANRIVMAPLTRARATPGTDAPNDLMVEYYRQRAGAGLIVTEASQISQQGQGYIHTPGIYTQEQARGWRRITDAVHEAGGKIVIQLWHVGRISHFSLQPGGGAPVAPSALKAKSRIFIAEGFTEPSEPRALETEEIPGIVADYAHAAGLAREAGFDGVEIHAANGYLLDQFQKDGTNHRADAYGGAIENRCRLTLEVVDAIAKVLPSNRIGIRLSPASPANDISDSNPQALFDYLVRELDARKLAYIHVIEGATQGARDHAPFDYAALRKAFHGAYIANNSYDRELAIQAIETGAADMIAFGRHFIANPDLVERLRRGAPLNPPDVNTFYGGGSEGYTDYPTLAA